MLILVLAIPVYAEEVIEEDLIEGAKSKEEKKDGLTGKLSLGTSISYTHNRNVVGSQDGSNFQLGLVLDGSTQYTKGVHEWLNELSIKETFSKTPSIEPLLKTVDNLAFQSTYFIHFEKLDWLGPFVRFRLETPLFAGSDVRASDTDIIKINTDGTTANETVEAQKKISLTSSFAPLQLKEIIGVFANPISEAFFVLEAKLGVGSMQTFTQKGYVINDDDKTPELELKQLEDYVQLGVELELVLSGALAENINWVVAANFFQPAYVSVESVDHEGFEGMDITIDAKLSVKLAKWISLDYVLSAKRIPVILEEWQIQNGLLLTAGFDLL